ncbi:uncharacterized protein LOC142328329 [Lycorma delicatula]|uniref:uncharacterized protein LOC142328329 n=1 Tax=Lycorma delicatula TaxID=130591 RepID=UPI003F50FD97
MSYKVEAVSEPLVLGEGPHWDIATQTLYFVDLLKGSVHSYKPSTNEHHSAVIGDGKHSVSIIIPIEGQKDKFLITLKCDLAIITWDGKSSKTSEPEIFATVVPSDSISQLNDGKADAKGRLWTGSVIPKIDGEFQPLACLYSIDNKKKVTKQLDDIIASNGLTWSIDNKKFYYIDTMKFLIYSYDYDIDSGKISNGKTLFNLKDHDLPELPDGMTIDEQGDLYVAYFNGSQILKIDPETGKLISKIDLPIAQITSVAFGGANLDELYVTSANINEKTFQAKEVNGINGCLLKVTNLGVKGVPMFNFKLYKMSYKVEDLTKPLVLGEGPHWDIATQTLYFVDIFKGSVHSYKPSTNEHFSAVIGDGHLPVSLIIPVEGEKNTFIISLKNDIAIISWDGKSSKASEPNVIASVEPKDNTNRINDGKADAKGRLWAGTMGQPGGPDGKTFEPVGAFYRIVKNNVSKHLSNITIANGLAWSSNNKKLYYIDSFKFRVDSYDYDVESGKISNEKTIFDFKANGIPGLPDGMTIDSEGKLYVANFNGSQILKIDPTTGKLITKIELPALQITSAAFGGPNLDELYVTSANINPETHQPQEQENGKNGCLFKVTNLGIKGVPMFNVKF